MTATVYFNGDFCEAAKAHLSIHDGGVLHGAGLFETIRAEGGKVFRLGAHLQRLQKSAAKLLRPIDSAQLPSADALEELLRRNRLSDARIRLTVTAGAVREEAPDSIIPPTVLATASPLVSQVQGVGERGVAVVICQFRQSATDPIAGHKSTSYLPRLLGLREAQAARCAEAFWFTTQNLLAEGSISNVFVVRGGVICTPPLDTPVVPGIARGVVLELAAKGGIATQERPLTIDDLLDADEVFLTNAIVQVMPVTRVEKKEIQAGRAGTLTVQMRQEYRSLVKKECGQA